MKPNEAATQDGDANIHANADATAKALEAAIVQLLSKRQPGATICPSDAARVVYLASAEWRAAMPIVRAVAAQLVAQGKLVVTQGGKVIDLHAAKGPIRLRFPPSKFKP